MSSHAGIRFSMRFGVVRKDQIQGEVLAGYQAPFVTREAREALLLAAMGGVGGISLGWVVTSVYANIKGWDTLVPAIALGGGIAAALLIGAVAGLYPAIRASRLSPTEALRTA